VFAPYFLTAENDKGHIFNHKEHKVTQRKDFYGLCFFGGGWS